MKHSMNLVKIWTAISWFSEGSMITLQGHIETKDYGNIFADQVHPMVQFPNGDVFQGNEALITQL